DEGELQREEDACREEQVDGGGPARRAPRDGVARERAQRGRDEHAREREESRVQEEPAEVGRLPARDEVLERGQGGQADRVLIALGVRLHRSHDDDVDRERGQQRADREERVHPDGAGDHSAGSHLSSWSSKVSRRWCAETPSSTTRSSTESAAPYP